MPDDRKDKITVHRPRRPAGEPDANASAGPPEDAPAASSTPDDAPLEVLSDDMRVEAADGNAFDADEPADRPMASDVNIAWREPDTTATAPVAPTVPRSDVNIDWRPREPVPPAPSKPTPPPPPPPTAPAAQPAPAIAASRKDTAALTRKTIHSDTTASTATSMVAVTYGRDAGTKLTPASRAQTILLAGAQASAHVAHTASHDPAPTAPPISDSPVEPPPPMEVLQEVQDAVDAARMAQVDWEPRSIRERGRVLDRLRRHLYLRRKEFTISLMEDAGIPEFEVLGIEIRAALEHLRFYRRAAAEVLSPVHRPPGFHRTGKTHEIQRVPWGVVGVIAPHQYPLAVPLAEVAAAVVAGNAVLLKLSENHPLTAALVREVFEAVQADCKDLPDGLIQLLPSSRDHGRSLAASEIDKIFMSGNRGAARSVLRASAEHLRPSSVTCGGQNPMIVLPDADADRAALAAVWSTFTSAGQTMSLVERVYVHESKVEAFVEQAGAITRTLRVGKSSGGFEVGSLTQEGLAIAEARIADAVAKGARVECGGRRVRGVTGGYMHPTVLADVTPEMDVWAFVNFSPILPVRTYTDLNEVIAEINGATFGLCASVFAGDVEAGRELACRLNVGTVAVNDAVVPYVDPALPWTGRGESGFGNSHGPEGLLAMTRVRAVSLDDDTQRYKPWWFPYNNDKTEGLRAALKLRHDPSPIERIKAWFKLVFDPEVRTARAGKEPPYVPGMHRDATGTQAGPFEVPLSRMFRMPTGVRRLVKPGDDEDQDDRADEVIPSALPVEEPVADADATALREPVDVADAPDAPDALDDVEDLPEPEAADDFAAPGRDVDDLPVPDEADGDFEDLPVPDEADDNDLPVPEAADDEDDLDELK